MQSSLMFLEHSIQIINVFMTITKDSTRIQCIYGCLCNVYRDRKPAECKQVFLTKIVLGPDSDQQAPVGCKN